MILKIATALALAIGSESPDRQALVELDQAYAAAWERNDAAAVMSLFADNAVILPHWGDPPRRGVREIRSFWFPTPPAAASVVKFDHHITDVTVGTDQGIVWGRFDLEFESRGKRTVSNGNFLLVARRQPDARWKISHLIWNDPPPVAAAATEVPGKILGDAVAPRRTEQAAADSQGAR